MSNLVVTNIVAADFSDLLFKVKDQISLSCDLKKRIIGENELYSGELNACEVY
ncbi:hypothetical protein [Leptospira soteropolitanensis]|uniref:hypothetical protein n=1 Tax=Leptospira soteropolitanensis TaxID=2950025 RepID=UPI00223C8C95|nr:hypothetical protein [Leptospira soteropolitanensis]MCW7493792.1 hypothetical protein [Leptospira soteropolitanensis]